VRGRRGDESIFSTFETFTSLTINNWCVRGHQKEWVIRWSWVTLFGEVNKLLGGKGILNRAILSALSTNF